MCFTMPANVLGIAEVGAFKEQMFNLAQMFIRILMLKFSTSAPILAIPCYALVPFSVCSFSLCLSCHSALAWQLFWIFCLAFCVGKKYKCATNSVGASLSFVYVLSFLLYYTNNFFRILIIMFFFKISI